MRTVVPVSGSDPKTRLAPVLSPEERQAFTEAMLADVVDAITAAGHEPEVISTAEIACPAPVTVDAASCVSAPTAISRAAVAI